MLRSRSRKCQGGSRKRIARANLDSRTRKRPANGRVSCCRAPGAHSQLPWNQYLLKSAAKRKSVHPVVAIHCQGASRTEWRGGDNADLVKTIRFQPGGTKWYGTVVPLLPHPRILILPLNETR